MKYGLYAMRDQKAGFLQPTVELNDEIAIRNFKLAVTRSKDSLFFTEPQDFSLYRIGSYETDTGVLSFSKTEPVVIALATEFALKDKDGEIYDISNPV